MIDPNWDLMLWLILLTWIITAVAGIPVLVSEWGKPKTLGYSEVISTAIVIIAVILILVL